MNENSCRVYENEGWINWGDWLGTGAIAWYNKEFRDFAEARVFARALRLKSVKEWLFYCRGESKGRPPKPDDIPSHPNQTYKNKGWSGWGDWLGK